MNSATENMQYQVTGLPAFLIFLAIGFFAFGLPSMKIAKRTGSSPWLALLMSVPFVNIVVIWVFAYSSWPGVDGVSNND
ncbi:hypothetical protein [uncultured Ruegeria sp.]|uniref:hypothetical protein n=1 Tax=uncultured Ruegeria sp. TaxID=259304 RepID=UPI0026154111|nr:hypothetical protein [uncultured Ruegeria sp.]